MLKYKCLVLDHDDTVVQSEATVNYPCFCRYLETYRPGESISLADYVGDCNKMAFVDMCKTRFAMTDAELEIEYGFWKDYAKTHMPDPFPGIGALLHKFRSAGGMICVSSMSAHDTILRDYRTHFGMEPDAVYGWELPPQQRKPNAYPLLDIMERFGLKRSEILVVDDMKLACQMAQPLGIQVAYSGWNGLGISEIDEEMRSLCDYSFDSTEKLYNFLFD